MKDPVFIKARICIRIEDENVCTMGMKTIILPHKGANKGVLRDGREVVKIEGKWYYIPSGAKKDEEAVY